MRLHDAALLALRTQLLDYFDAVGGAIGAGGGEGGGEDGGEGGGGARQAHTLFGFEHSMHVGAAERALLGQLAWQASSGDPREM